MCILAVGESLELEPGLAFDEVHSRLKRSAQCYHRQERYLSYYLLEMERRGLYFRAGFSNIADYAMAVLGIKSAKTRSLLRLAAKLEELGTVAAAFDAGEISWTKAREVARVATRETQQEWLARAKRLSNRALERLVRKELRDHEIEHLHIDMPADVMKVWLECEELAERLSGCELAGYQVLEAMMAEFLATYGPDFRVARARSLSPVEEDIPAEVRELVYQRDQWRCQFPDCTMRAELDIHHLKHRSQGGDHSPENLIVVCRAHHALVHQGICNVRGTAPGQLVWQKPFEEKFAGEWEDELVLPGTSEEEVVLRTAEEAGSWTPDEVAAKKGERDARDADEAEEASGEELSAQCEGSDGPDDGDADPAELGELSLDSGDEGVGQADELSLDSGDDAAEPDRPRTRVRSSRTRVRPRPGSRSGPSNPPARRSRCAYPQSSPPGWLIREGMMRWGAQNVRESPPCSAPGSIRQPHPELAPEQAPP